MLMEVISIGWEAMGSSEKDSSPTPRNLGRLPGGGDPAATWKRKACDGTCWTQDRTGPGS